MGITFITNRAAQFTRHSFITKPANNNLKTQTIHRINIPTLQPYEVDIPNKNTHVDIRVASSYAAGIEVGVGSLTVL
ncbi:hypothetical protein BELL_0551g00080 [Botrytis elliptica]|uniref:Uncharacterized protein n=1 Tax=Botrytis elliptica TaxID=278938 RepID=A0A4Z1JK30_9HELO|nr:hypothetical protein EAE99_000492 [Botrytis elliptica]TGO71622.1 hypothetical protein BELL_0551g00080 [Botrytis elliptica]